MVPESEYRRLLEEAVELDEKGDYQAAAAIFERLIDTDLPDLDKSMICLNLATLSKKMGLEEESVVGWYERAVEYENTDRTFAAEQLAAYLGGRGRKAESLQ